MATYNKRGHKAPKPKEVNELDTEFENNVDSGESTTADVFNNLDEGANKIETWVASNQKIILGVVAAIAVATLGYLLYNKFVVEPNEDKAANAIFQSQTYFEQALSNPATSDSLFTLALNGGEGNKGFVKIASDYSGTETGNIANYYAGMSFLHKKDFKNAEKHLLDFSSNDFALQAQAYGAIGDAYSETNKNEEAIKYYLKAAKENENSFTSPRFLLKAAQLAYLNGDKDKANSLFKDIKEKYETSQEAANIDAFIAMTEK